MLDSTNPISNLLIEYSLVSKNKFFPINIIRPSINDKNKIFRFQISNISYNNSGFSNIHNNGEIIANYGYSNYTNYSMMYYGKFVSMKFSPKTRKYNFNLSSVKLTAKNINKFDIVVIATDHDDYDLIKKHSRLIVDTRGGYRPSEKVVIA